MTAVTQTLRFRLTCAFTLLVSITSVMLAVSAHRTATSSLFKLHHRTGEIVCRHAAQQAIGALENNDLERIATILNELRNEPFVTYAEFFDSDLRFLGGWSNFAQGEPPPVTRPGELATERVIGGNHFIEFHLRVPVDPSREPLGSLRIGLTQMPLRERADDVTRRFGVLVLATILLGALAAWMLIRSAVRPVTELIRATARISRGEFFAADRIVASGELGTLGRSLARMGHALKRMNEELETANSTLESKVAARTEELQQALDELKVIDQMKDDFLSSVSHEFKTPLTSIRAYAEILQHFENEDAATRSEFLSIILVESERLTSLVNDVIDLARFEAGDLSWRVERIDLAELAEEALRSFRPLLSQHGLSTQVIRDGTLTPIDGDRDRIYQVFTNLVSNAIKFSQDGSSILIRAHDRADDEVEVVVSDEGFGIAPDDHDRIFDRFAQLGDTLTDKPSGTGLGLSICRNIVERHGGQIWVESNRGCGSRFHFTLPRSGPIGFQSSRFDPHTGSKKAEKTV